MSNEQYIQRVLEDSDLYLSEEDWFRLLQDDGNPMTDEESAKVTSNPKTKFTRKTIGNSTNNNKLYEDIYKLAEEVYKKIEVKKEQYFPRLATSKTSNIHIIGRFIVSRRSSTNRADMHRHSNEDVIQYANMPEFAEKQYVFVLSQREVLEFCHQKYGISMSLLKTPTVDDKVRVAGIVFNIADVRAYLSDMLGKSKDGDRTALDGANPRSTSGFFLLHQKFIDNQVEVTVPERWEERET
jgi:hypothetical protein